MLALKSLLFSKTKVQKLKNLLYEHFKILCGKSLGKSYAGCINTTTARQSAELHTWTYQSKLIFTDINRMSLALTANAQDNLVDTQLVTEFDYSLVRLINAAVYTNSVDHVSIFDANGERHDLISVGKMPKLAQGRLHLKAGETITGQTLSLCGALAVAGGNYGHWLIDGLPRLFLALEKYQLLDFDNVLVPTLCHDFHLESLLEFGVRRDSIIVIESLKLYQFESLVCTTPPRGRSSGVVPGWLLDHYQQYAASKLNFQNNGGWGKIYISRADAPGRHFKDEKTVKQTMESLGFQSVELSKYTFVEKVRIFRQAKVIVGLTGAGLSNLMFCKEGTSVVELKPSTNPTYIFTSICSYVGLNYYPLVFDGESFVARLNPYYGSFDLDLRRLSDVVSRAISAPDTY